MSTCDIEQRHMCMLIFFVQC